jgi:hypothetical protein
MNSIFFLHKRPIKKPAFFYRKVCPWKYYKNVLLFHWRTLIWKIFKLAINTIVLKWIRLTSTKTFFFKVNKKKYWHSFKNNRCLKFLKNVTFLNNYTNLKRSKSTHLLVFEFDFIHCLWSLLHTTYLTEWLLAIACKCMQDKEFSLMGVLKMEYKLSLDDTKFFITISIWYDT